MLSLETETGLVRLASLHMLVLPSHMAQHRGVSVAGIDGISKQSDKFQPLKIHRCMRIIVVCPHYCWYWQAKGFLSCECFCCCSKEIWLRQMLRNITILRDEKFANTYLYRMLGCLYRWVFLLWSYILIFTGIVSM